MMTTRWQIILILMLLMFLSYSIQSIRSNRISVKFVLPWIAMDIVLLVLTLFPVLLEWMRSILGIYSTVNMIFFCGFVLALLVLYSMSIASSKTAEEMKRIAQKMALEDESGIYTDKRERQDPDGR